MTRRSEGTRLDALDVGGDTNFAEIAQSTVAEEVGGNGLNLFAGGNPHLFGRCAESTSPRQREVIVVCLIDDSVAQVEH